MATLRDEALLHALLVDWPSRRARCHCPWGWTGKWEVEVRSLDDKDEVMLALMAAHENHIREHMDSQKKMWAEGEELVGLIEPDRKAIDEKKKD